MDSLLKKFESVVLILTNIDDRLSAHQVIHTFAGQVIRSSITYVDQKIRLLHCRSNFGAIDQSMKSEQRGQFRISLKDHFGLWINFSKNMKMKG